MNGKWEVDGHQLIHYRLQRESTYTYKVRVSNCIVRRNREEGERGGRGGKKGRGK